MSSNQLDFQTGPLPLYRRFAEEEVTLWSEAKNINYSF